MIMTKNIITIDKDQNLKDAMRFMEKSSISRLLVTEGGEIIGIITEEDIARRLGTGRERKLKTEHIHVSGAMTRDLKVISSDTGIREAAKIMLENKFSSLPVVTDGKIIGLVTKTDLVKNLIESEGEIRDFYTSQPISVSAGCTLVSARKLMLDEEIHRLLVTDNGLLTGILTERDIAKGLGTFRKAIDKYIQADIKRLKVENVMTQDPITIKPETSVKEAVSIMLDNKISGIPVVGDDFGILTKTDLVGGISEGILP